MGKKEQELVMKIADNADQIKPMRCYDADNDAWVTFTARDRDDAHAWINEIKTAQQMIFRAILEGIRRQYHLCLGYESVTEFVKSMGFGRTQTHRYKKIGDVVARLGARLDDDKKDAFVANAKELGPAKIYEICRMSLDDVETLLLDEGVIERNGEQISLKEASAQSRDTIAETISKINRAERAKSSLLKQDIALIKEEKKELEKRLEEASKTGQELEQELALYKSKYGEKATEYQSKINYLDMAQQAQSQFFSALVKANISDDDPLEILEKFALTVNLVMTKVDQNAHTWRQLSDVTETAS